MGPCLRVYPAWREGPSESNAGSSRGHRSRATVIADTPIAPAARSALGACRKRRPGRDDVVDEDDPAVRRGPSSNGPGAEIRNEPLTLLPRAVRSSWYWAAVARARSRTGANGHPQLRAGGHCDEHGLVVAALVVPVRVHGDGHDHVTAGADTSPAAATARPSGSASRRSPPYSAREGRVARGRCTAHTTPAGAAAVGCPRAARSACPPAPRAERPEPAGTTGRWRHPRAHSRRNRPAARRRGSCSRRRRYPCPDDPGRRLPVTYRGPGRVAGGVRTRWHDFWPIIRSDRLCPGPPGAASGYG